MSLDTPPFFAIGAAWVWNWVWHGTIFSFRRRITDNQQRTTDNLLHTFCRPRLLPLLALFAAAIHSVSWAGMAHSQQEDAPVISVHRQPAIPLVALRMSLLADDPPGLAGAGHLFQHLHYPRLLNEAQNVGAQVRIERTADAVVYTVTGPTAEIRFLASILRSTLQPPTAGEGALLTAHRELEEERLAEWERADRHLRSALRNRLFPMDISAAGTENSARRLSGLPLDEVWARLYRPERISVLAVGDVDLEEVRQEFVDLPPALRDGSGRELADTATLLPVAPAEATRGWFAAGYLADDLPPAAVSVAARLLGDNLRERLPGSEVFSEHWWTRHGHALALMVAVPPQLLTSAPQVLHSLPTTFLSQVTEAGVGTAARAIRHDMLFYSRTPDRMAEVLGQFMDRGGNPSSAQEFYSALASVDIDDVRAVLRHLIDAAAVRVEIPPQKLNLSP